MEVTSYGLISGWRRSWRMAAGIIPDGDPNSAHFFAKEVIDRSSHAIRIEFDLNGQKLEPVKLAFEQRGYSVHPEGDRPQHLVAYRVTPDRDPSLSTAP